MQIYRAWRITAENMPVLLTVAFSSIEQMAKQLAAHLLQKLILRLKVSVKRRSANISLLDYLANRNTRRLFLRKQLIKSPEYSLPRSPHPSVHQYLSIHFPNFVHYRTSKSDYLLIYFALTIKLKPNTVFDIEHIVSYFHGVCQV